MVYSVIGLGKLGASMVAAIAKRGFQVIGMDVIEETVRMVNEGHAPVYETDLEETISANKQRIHATLSCQDAVLSSDLTFVVVSTPSDEKGAFSLKYGIQSFREIGQALKDKEKYHNVVMTSTVLPGSMRYGLLPILEQESGKKCGRDFGLCYSPEFIALGSVIHDFLNPDFTLVGEYDTRSGEQLEVCYSEIMENEPPCQRMSFENAELTKIALNTFVTTKITFANMLAELCERLPGGDVDIVTDALGLDKRIGQKYLTGALGYGGPCFPRDNVALNFIANALGAPAMIPETIDSINRSIPSKIVERLRPLIQDDATVAILGLSYKPYSNVIEESQGVYIAKSLVQDGKRVIAYDPLANETARNEIGDHVGIMDSVAECLSEADIILVTTPDPEFKELTIDDFSLKGSDVIVIDFWRILANKLSGKDNIRYIPVGRSIEDELNGYRLSELWGEKRQK